MKKVFLLLSIIFCSSFHVFCQAPGYMGKKASLTLSLSGFPVITGPTKNNKGSNSFDGGEGWFGLNYEWEGNFAYTVGRYTSLSLIGGQYVTGVVMDAVSSPAGYPHMIPSEFGGPWDRHQLFLHLKVKSIALVVNNFSKSQGGLAPFGNHFFYGLKRNFVTYEVAERNTEYHWHVGSDDETPDLDINEKIGYMYFLLGWSNNRILWDKLIIKTGFRLAFPIKHHNYYFDGPQVHEKYDDNINQANYEVDVYSRLFGHELIRMDIGVGYLLF